ncbi:unnamed protein product [Paramecium sonneborni]|uniref:Transmembrane protein n=1 Tax=Paramecium sonneborni TaxID=65129 RepID=A0A8S1RSS3_9CILI|nr:unnamed protein product [Paramecium sonneborni]
MIPVVFRQSFLEINNEYFYLVVLIKQLDFGKDRINFSFNKQSLTIQMKYYHQVQITLKANLLHVQRVNQYLQWKNLVLIKNGVLYKKIQLDQYGLRLHLINDQLFILQPYLQEKILTLIQIQIYYALSCDLCYDRQSFPIQNNQLKQFIVKKNGKSINVMMMKDNGGIGIEQLIEFRSCGNYGQLSKDGNYLLLGIVVQDKFKYIYAKRNGQFLVIYILIQIFLFNFHQF